MTTYRSAGSTSSSSLDSLDSIVFDPRIESMKSSAECDSLTPSKDSCSPWSALTSVQKLTRHSRTTVPVASVNTAVLYCFWGSSFQSMKYSCFVFLVVIALVRISTSFMTSNYLRTAWEDLMINQEFLSVGPQPIMTDKYRSQGRVEIQQSDVTIVGVARNIASGLPTLLPQIEELAGRFRYSQVVFVEGDSDDATLPSLIKWAAKLPHNRTVISVSSSNDQETNIHFQARPLAREGRLANARNRLLQEVEKLPIQTKYMIMLDTDIIGWNPYGVEDSFGRSDDWDVICANGIILHGLYRDTYAFRSSDIDTNHHKCGSDHGLYNITWNERASQRKVKALMDINEQMESNLIPKPIPVSSCFGGMTIYRLNVVKDCRYNHRYSAPPYMLDCEHVLFHKCIEETSHARILSNPHMKLWYGHTNVRKVDYKRLMNSLLPKK